MSLFTSDRERRLWFWTLAAVAALYATLGLTPALAEALRDSNELQAVFFLVAMFLVGATVVTQGLKLRPGGTEIGVALGIAAVYLMLFLRLGLAERSHLIEYGVVAVFIHEALRERASQGRRVPVPAILAILAASLVGVLDESIQVFLPNRVFDLRDIGFNVLAGLMAVLASLALSWARQRAGRFLRNRDRQRLPRPPSL